MASAEHDPTAILREALEFIAGYGQTGAREWAERWPEWHARYEAKSNGQDVFDEIAAEALAAANMAANPVYSAKAGA